MLLLLPGAILCMTGIAVQGFGGEGVVQSEAAKVTGTFKGSAAQCRMCVRECVFIMFAG